MTIAVGEQIPQINFTTMTDEGPKPVTPSELFTGKKVALFSVPGAFTPTCSLKHLPGFVQQSEKLQEKGIDTVCCMSVNDVFVMDAWRWQWRLHQSIGLGVGRLRFWNGYASPTFFIDC